MAKFEWQPTASRDALLARQTMLHQIRQFFLDRNVLEVETPILGQAPVCDPNIEPFEVMSSGYLQTSPEYAMKRLLCAGYGDMFQVCKVFRRGEAGRRHNPEFSMLEWYRVGWDHHRLMEEVALLVREVLNRPTAPMLTLTYQEALMTYANLDLRYVADQQIESMGIRLAGQDLALNRDGWLDVIVSHQVEPSLPPETLVFVHDFPASQAALAKVRQTETSAWAERFELFFNGSELANGYHELTDVQEQRARFEKEMGGGDSPDQRFSDDVEKHQRLLDERLLAAMESGLPDCAGVAMGLDRILMHRLGVDSISEVVSFDTLRA